MVDLRKILIVFVIAVLFSILVFAVIEAVYPQPKYEDFCKNRYYDTFPAKGVDVNCTFSPTPAEQKNCSDQKGFMDSVEFDKNGCTSKYECNTCQARFDDANENYRLYVFYISAFFSLIAIFIGLFLPETNTLNEWLGTGFMLGGTFALLFGTAFSYTALGRYTKPIVIFLELALIIFVAYKKLSKDNPDKRPKKKSR